MKFEQLQIGMSDSTSKLITEQDILTFAELSTDKNPLHIDPVAASKGMFGRQVAHGILVSGLISAVLGTKLPGEGSVYLGQDLKFKRPVFIGDTITAKAEIIELREDKHIVILKTTCTNQDGVVVIDGQATIMVK
jgi:3-hydroxybutyryl-CoA dehydratase